MASADLLPTSSSSQTAPAVSSSADQQVQDGMTSKGLCSKCRVCTTRPFERAGTVVDDLNYETCDLCHIIYEIIRQAMPRGRSCCEWVFIDGASSSTPLLWGDQRSQPMCLDVYCPANRPCPWADAIFGSARTISSLLDDTTTRILHWIDQCDSQHGCSRDVQTSTKLPTRVLDVSAERVRLFESRGAEGRYTTLSHCWGGHRRPLITRNRDDLALYATEGIPWSVLPPTYQDAVQLTRSLNVQYLWIDSLCILQHDRADWISESEVMGDVYRNSFLTIAATAAKDATARFLARSEGHDIAQVAGTTAFGTPFEIKARPRIGHLSGSRDASLAESWPLLTRGWIFQERLLSPRVLHFGAQEMLWYCNAAAWCECGDQYGDHCARRRLKREMSPSILVPKNDRTAPWHELVSTYSELILSVPSDRLPAIGGVAKSFAQRKPNARYVAGIWDDTADEDILWYAETKLASQCLRNQEHGRRLPSSPSWTWAGWLADITFPFSGMRLEHASGEVENSRNLKWHHVVEINCLPMKPGSTTEFRPGGTLTIQANIFRGRIHKIIPSAYPIGPSQECSYWVFRADRDSGPFEETEAVVLPDDYRMPATESDATCIRMVRGTPNTRAQMFFPWGSPVHVIQARTEEPSEMVTEWAMMVKFDQDRGRYSRVGMLVEIPSRDRDGELKPSAFEAAWHENGRQETIILE